MIYLVDYDLDYAQNIIMVIKGPKVDMNKLKDNWIKDQIGEAPKWPFEKPVGWVDMWPRYEEEGAEAHYQKCYDYNKKLSNLRLEDFVNLLKNKGFKSVEFTFIDCSLFKREN